MKNSLRPRNYLLVGGSLAVMFFLYYTDPNGGAITAMLAAQLATPIIAVLFAHAARKALFDYADMLDLYRKAMESPVGAAIVYAAMCGVLFALLGLFGGQVRAASVDTVIPKNAYALLPTLRSEQQQYWSDHPKFLS